jgi:hypothetical protein
MARHTTTTCDRCKTILNQPLKGISKVIRGVTAYRHRFIRLGASSYAMKDYELCDDCFKATQQFLENKNG